MKKIQYFRDMLKMKEFYLKKHYNSMYVNPYYNFRKEVNYFVRFATNQLSVMEGIYQLIQQKISGEKALILIHLLSVKLIMRVLEMILVLKVL